MTKKILIGLAAAVVLAAAGLRLFGEPLLRAAMKRQVVHLLSGAAFRELTGGLNVVVCGAGTPLPDPLRAGPCVAVIAGERVIVVDAGSGAPRRLAISGIQNGRVGDVLLTHFHSDHIDGLGELMLQRWANAAATAPLPVHGPPGVEEVVAGFNRAYALDDGYRVAHHGENIVPRSGAGGTAVPFALPAPGQAVVVLEGDGLKVTAFAVDHAPTAAVGYRFDYRGRSVVVSGDTAKSANLQRFAAGADVLIHEALNPELLRIVQDAAHETGAANIEQIMKDIVGYHATPVQAAEVAQAAGVKHLVFYHVIPALPAAGLERAFVKGVAEAFPGAVTVARDGTWIALPPDSTAIEIRQRL